VMILSAIVLVAVASVLKYARIGKAMRAMADNMDLAESSGIDVGRISVIVWASGAGLAALGGVFLGVVVNIQYLMGFQLLLLMFAAVILGGLGSAYGAMIGGLVVGYISEVSTLWLRPELKTVWALIVLVAVLLFRPQGILGLRDRIG
jgi:neutral amino acid transport system permease protein